MRNGHDLGSGRNIMNSKGSNTPRKLGPRTNNNSFNAASTTGSNGTHPSASHRLIQTVKFIGVLLVVLQFVYNSNSESAKEETLDKMRLLVHGADTDTESQQQARQL